MTPEAVIYQFLAGFGIPAYAFTSVPDEAEYPYLTYELTVGSFFEEESPIIVNLWYRGDGEAAPNAKAHELAKALPVILQCDGGAVWLKRGDPWCQSMADESDDKIKRRYINVTAEFITSY